MRRILFILSIVACALMPCRAADKVETDLEHLDADVDADAMHVEVDDAEKEVDAKEIIFHHLGDRYGWEVPFCHDKSIPLPIIVITDDGVHCFSSSRLYSSAHEEGSHDKKIVIYDDNGVKFCIAPEGSEYSGKVVEILPDGSYKRPIDISITKNVCAIFIACLIVAWCVLALARWSRRNPFKAPRKTLGGIESLVYFIYDSVIKKTLGAKAPKFAPYLLTVFMFIFFMNLLGLMVVFPGGANVTGNVAVTLTLALLTFVFTNLFATKHYWKEIFWPDVPLFLKFPLPIMQVIEFFGMFTKPAALTVRLFANMMGGHMIVLVLTLLIFIFGAMSQAVGAATAVVSVIFSVFMLLIDVLVSFIQAYVFTMLSTVFIAQAQASGHEEHESKHVEEGESAVAATAKN